MKRKVLLIASMAFAAFGLQSCLDYDNPGDELGADEVVLDPNANIKGQSDVINYEREISQEGLTKAIDAMKNYFSQSLTGQYCLRGAKEGNVPQAHAYQRQYALGPDAYAQYAVVPHKDFMYGTITSTYNVSKEFNGDPHSSYTMTKNALVPLLNQPLVDTIPEMKAINLLFLSLAAQERCDLSGPFTFFEDKQNNENPTVYNNVEEIYMNIEQCLRTIVDCLNYFEQRPEWYQKEINKLLKRYNQSAYEMLYGEYTVKPYIKLANSLKLRMAMNMVKVNPDLAKQWAEEAVAAGVIEDVKDQTGIFPMISGFSHPLIDISESWGDWRLSASFESLLMSLNHPYTKEGYLFEKNGIINGNDGSVLEAGTKIVGIRGGTLVGDGQTNPPNQRVNYSRISKANFQMTPLYYIKWSEVDFLRAEGAIRDWEMGGTAQEFYERGIRNGSFEDPMMPAGTIYADAIEEYINLAEPIPYVQQDPLKDELGGDVSDWPSTTKIGVKWNDGDSQEIKLEKIITQKYIALFPNSWQAWTDLRRTGYPKLFPVLNTDDGDGSIQQGEMIRRIPWAATDPQEIANINATGIPALGGPDLQATRLWWDADCGNFESVNSIDRATADEAGEVWLDNGHLYFSGAETVRIYSADGKLIKTAENAQSVSVADFATGVYLVTVTGNGHTATVKVAIK